MLFHLNFIKLHSSLFQADRFGLNIVSRGDSSTNYGLNGKTIRKITKKKGGEKKLLTGNCLSSIAYLSL